MMLAFVPLEMAPWGISIQEPEEDVFAPASRLKRTFATLAVIFIGTAFILTIGISRSIVDPLNELIRAPTGSPGAICRNRYRPREAMRSAS